MSGRYDLCESVLRRLLPQKSFTHTSASGAPCTSALSMIASRSSKTKPQMTELKNCLSESDARERGDKASDRSVALRDDANSPASV